jgi:hypothetical protein
MAAPSFRQAAFAAALLGPEPVVPPGLAAGTKPHRFEVYRRNVQAGLARALAARFPVVRALVGEAFFTAMARDFALRHPPASPVLLEYGRDLPAYIRGFAPADAVPYLADVAALETARGEAWHAPSHPAADPATLHADDLAEARLLLQPSLRVVRSPHPVLAIWAHHQEDGGTIDWQPQSVALHRHGMEVVQEAVAPGEAEFLARLLAGATIGAAFHAAAAEDGAFDATAAFAWLLARELVVALVPGIQTHGEQSDVARQEHGAARAGVVG